MERVVAVGAVEKATGFIRFGSLIGRDVEAQRSQPTRLAIAQDLNNFHIQPLPSMFQANDLGRLKLIQKGITHVVDHRLFNIRAMLPPFTSSVITASDIPLRSI